ncbi:hypothetical protein [Corynebacterium sp. HMSC30G07]|uniref:hypothetical protein n=1 Tax=Corynebacterium sp. HMSC30G07 TaxID=1581072 RepID=UPI0014390E73|nr:hypothetical protein [Corynebacterium sp. HMSC30G07]
MSSAHHGSVVGIFHAHLLVTYRRQEAIGMADTVEACGVDVAAQADAAKPTH